MSAPQSIERHRVTWMRPGKRGRTQISHPIQWIWTDGEGYERSYDTKAEACAARAEQLAEIEAL